jgi:hypothetical protein
MKIYELTHEQLEELFLEHPNWVADNFPHWMIDNKTEWMIQNRPEWKADDKIFWNVASRPNWINTETVPLFIMDSLK